MIERSAPMSAFSDPTPSTGKIKTDYSKTKDGDPITSVQIEGLHPMAFKASNRLSLLFSAAWTGFALYLNMISPQLFSSAEMLLVPAVTHWPLKWLLRSEFTRRQTLHFTPEEITWCRHFRPNKRFDRSQPHHFVVLPNERNAQKEDRRLSAWEQKYAQRWYLPSTRTRYWGDAGALYLVINEQRIKLMTLSQMERAQDIQAWLNYQDKKIDTRAGKLGGTITRPQDEWAGQRSDMDRF